MVLQTPVQGCHALDDLPDLLTGDIQLPEKSDLGEPVHIRQGVFPIAVGGVASRGDQTLLLVEADILFGDAHQLFDLIDLHDSLLFDPDWPFFTKTIRLPPGGRSSTFSLFYIFFSEGPVPAANETARPPDTVVQGLGLPEARVKDCPTNTHHSH